MDKTALVAAAKELNRVLGLEPPIDLGGGVDDLQVEILDVTELVTPEDELSPETLAVLRELSGSDGGSDSVPEVDEPRVADGDVAESKLGKVHSDPTALSAKKGKGKKKPAPRPSPPKPKKKTRADVMAGILEASRERPMTRKEMISHMHEAYGGSEAEAKFNVYLFTRLLLVLGILDQDDAGRLRYVGGRVDA